MTTHKTSSSFEDDDNDTDSPYHEPINQDNCIKAYALYDFNGMMNVSKLMNEKFSCHIL